MNADGLYGDLRVDQVGSLLRPEPLIAAFAAFDGGQISEADLRRETGAQVAAALAEQQRRGIVPLSDGEFWRRNFQDTFGESVSGYGYVGTVTHTKSADSKGQVSEAAYVRRRPAVQRLQLARNRLLEDYRADREYTDGPLKVTMVGPERLTQRFDLEHSGDVYDSFEMFMDDVVGIQRQMIAEVIDAGCGYVQIDEPAYTAYVDPVSLEWMDERGWDPEAGLARAIAADNAVIDGFAGTTFGLHICRGNGPGGVWHREGAYDRIAEQLFSGLRYPRLLLEYDTERAGGFEPLRFVPKGTIAVLGLVSTKKPDLESKDMLLRRIDEASRFLPLDQLAISPQCGFASDLIGNPLTELDQWRKLELVRDVAESVWGG